MLLCVASCAPLSPWDQRAPGAQALCASHPAAAAGGLREQTGRIDLTEVIAAPGEAFALFGVSVRSLSTGRTLFQENEGKLFVPASTMKLLTTAAVLIRLGPEFRYTTHLYAGGPVADGVLKGDLLFRGSGDPTISDAFQGRAQAVFEEWADRLAGQGIREIGGDVVGDDHLFNDRRPGGGWPRDMEPACYAARVSAVSFNENCLEATVSPGAGPGEAALVTIDPRTAYGKIRNEVTTGRAGAGTEIEVRQAPDQGEIIVTGRIDGAGPPRPIRFAAANPTLYAATVLKEVLERKGIKVRGRAMDRDGTPPGEDYASMRVLVSHRSPPLSRIIREVNKRSQNLYAELLFRTLGALYGGGGTGGESARVVKESLAAMGIPPDSLAIYDGSGLSRLNLVTPAQVVQLLSFMAGHPYFDAFRQSLPIAGVDGTMARRMKASEAEHRIMAKTGSLTHVAALSGYALDRDGRLLAFSVMTNNCLHEAHEVRALQDAICLRLVRFSEGR